MYKIRFDDNSEFVGGNPLDSKWNSIPTDREIASMQYKLCGIGFILKGFESYNHLVEQAILVSKPQDNNKILRVIICGKWQSRIYKVIFDYINKQVRTEVESINPEAFIHPEKYSLPVNSILKTTGWKKGKFEDLISPKLQHY